jgi:hypothetical protein
MHPPTHIQTQTASKEENGQKNKKRLTSIRVKQYNKHCAIKREHTNSEEGSRL